MGATKVWLEAEIARVDCRRCDRVRTEDVPWARPRARHSRDFEDVVGWLAQRMDKTSITKLMRCSWEAVNGMVMNLVEDNIDDTRLDGLFNLGVDEIAYKRGHTYLTIVADHDSGNVVWVGEGASTSTLSAFFEELGPDRCQQVKAMSMDMASRWKNPCATHIPQATVCYDQFHVMKWCNEALDAVYKSTGRDSVSGVGDHDWRRTRTALRTGYEKLKPHRQALIDELRRDRPKLWKAWDLKERLRDLFRGVEPDVAAVYLDSWCIAATSSGITPFVTLAKRFRKYFNGIVAAVEHGLSNSRVEGINSKIRLINRRAHGHRTANSLTAMIYLCLGGITLTLPTER
jgi:transposase